MRLERELARMGQKRDIYTGLVLNPGWKRPLGRMKRRWGCNIKMDFQEVECGGIDWTTLTQDSDRW